MQIRPDTNDVTVSKLLKNSSRKHYVRSGKARPNTNNMKPRQGLAFPAELPGLLRYGSTMDDYSMRRVATTGHEVMDQEGRVVAWTVDRDWAALLVSLLNKALVARRHRMASLDRKR